jgi:hypothetical protein
LPLAYECATQGQNILTRSGQKSAMAKTNNVLNPAHGILRRQWKNLRWQSKRLCIYLTHPEAANFCDGIFKYAYLPRERFDLLPDYRLLYIAVPKAACTRVRMTLIELMQLGRNFDRDVNARLLSDREVHARRFSGLPGVHQIGVVAFHRLVTDPRALRFSFVRNPYERLISCWADKFQNQPLSPSNKDNKFIQVYLRKRLNVDANLPAGQDKVLSFPDFVTFATATASHRVDPHWQLQSDIIDIPGIRLDLVGRVESFERDFARVLDHVGVKGGLRARLCQPLNVSRRSQCVDYFNSELASRVYEAYERDFETFHYPKTVPV